MSQDQVIEVMDMNNADKTAMPAPADGSPGLTKREYFAGLAMQGLAPAFYHDPEHCANRAVKYADALLEALEHKND